MFYITLYVLFIYISGIFIYTFSSKKIKSLSEKEFTKKHARKILFWPKTLLLFLFRDFVLKPVLFFIDILLYVVITALNDKPYKDTALYKIMDNLATKLTEHKEGF